MSIAGGSIGEAPNTSPGRLMGQGGLALKKKLAPKAAPKKLTEKKGWKKSFSVYTTKLVKGKKA